jgi:hypothetical protein
VIVTRVVSCGIVPVNRSRESVEAARRRLPAADSVSEGEPPGPLLYAAMRQPIVIEWVEA